MRRLFATLGFLVFLGQPGTAGAQDANQAIVGIISGGVGGTYVQFAQNLADVLDDPEALRVLAMLGKGSQQNIKDLLFLNQVDLAIVQSDVLAHYKNTGEVEGIDRKIGYVTKLYNEEIHILARENIRSLKQLDGARVSVGRGGSGTEMTARIVLNGEGISVRPVNLSNSEALAALKDGTIEAAIFVVGKPSSFFRGIEETAGLHFLPIELSKALQEIYLDGVLTGADYPNLIQQGGSVPTIAVGAVMAVFNWRKGSHRYNRTALFIERMFDALPILQTDSYHPKWTDVDITKNLPGWRRYPAAQAWLDQNQ